MNESRDNPEESEMKRFVMCSMMAGAVALPAVSEEAAAPLWAEDVTLGGDLRLRHEYIDQDGKEERHRQRVRARVSMDAVVEESVKVGVQLATGESDEPISTNQSLDNSFSKKSLWLDLAYLQWAACDSFDVIGGKMAKPWMSVSDLVWDGDLNPEGLAVNAKMKGDGGALMVNAGGFWIDELSSTSDDRMLYVAQVAGEAKLGGAKWTLGGSAFSYDNMKGLSPLYDESDSFGNDVVEVVDEDGETTLQYATDFLLYEVFTAVDMKAGELPVRLYAHGVSNDDASDEDMGYLLGLRLGKAKEPGQMEFDYTYREVEANSVVGAFTDSDSFGGGSDGEGHRVKGSLAVTKNVKVDATLFVNAIDPDGKDVDYTRAQLDLNAKF